MLQDSSADTYDTKAPSQLQHLPTSQQRRELWLLRAGLLVAAVGLLGSLMAGGVACESQQYDPKAVDWTV